ncbi:MAG: glycoside hydrolase family 43 protein [Phycisphaeraceae bacterium]|nr:glycoside hydrolase family 43 protein [Phycisphaeraceae bacterium]MCW5761621.1 glycoside hydrolase family 43 protein [Phycisphaeraceae bacterium]
MATILSVRGLHVLGLGVLALGLGGCAGRRVSQGPAPEPIAMSGNPVFEGWYADPEGMIFGDRYWIFPTFSAPYDQQLHFDAFSSPDLVTWTKHERVLTSADITWARRAMWAPAVIEKDNRFFLFFGANDIQSDQELGGIGVAVADKPEGPYRDLLGKPLIDRFHHGAQPIDQFVFRDSDGTDYLIYGGWRHCNIARLRDDYRGFEAFDDGEIFKEITPEGYVEGPFMFKRDGRYYFMWSEGGWTGPDYRVAYAIADSVMGPWQRIGVVLQQDPAIATGAGHHSVIRKQGRGGEAGRGGDEWFIVYHRRPLGETDRNHRVVCIDRMEFDEHGFIKPVKITFEGVPASPLKPN